MKCSCGTRVVLDSGKRKPAKPTPSGKERKPQKPRYYDLSKWYTHVKVCEQTTGIEARSRKKRKVVKVEEIICSKGGR